jgi:uncharacterized RDD family membrane protein YckC
MDAIVWIVAWGIIALVAAVAAGVIAANKNRHTSTWIAWSFLLPPLLLVLWLLPRREGPPAKRVSADDEDGEDAVEEMLDREG